MIAVSIAPNLACSYLKLFQQICYSEHISVLHELISVLTDFTWNYSRTHFKSKIYRSFVKKITLRTLLFYKLIKMALSISGACNRFKVKIVWPVSIYIECLRLILCRISPDNWSSVFCGIFFEIYCREPIVCAIFQLSVSVDLKRSLKHNTIVSAVYLHKLKWLNSCWWRLWLIYQLKLGIIIITVIYSRAVCVKWYIIEHMDFIAIVLSVLIICRTSCINVN